MQNHLRNLVFCDIAQNQMQNRIILLTDRNCADSVLRYREKLNVESHNFSDIQELVENRQGNIEKKVPIDF